MAEDFNHVTIITLKRKPKPQHAATIAQSGLTAHTGNTVARILRRIESKIEDVLGEDQFGFRTGKGVLYAIGMLRIMSE